MPHVQACAEYETNDVEAIFSHLCDFEQYPQLADAVRYVDVRHEGSQTMSYWEADFRNGILAWEEVDNFDRDRGIVSFDLHSGDFTQLTGEWNAQLTDEGDVRVTFEASFDFGIPSMNDVIHPIAHETLQRNVAQIFEGLATHIGVDVHLDIDTEQADAPELSETS